MNQQEFDEKMALYEDIQARKLKFRREMQRTRFWHSFNSILVEVALFSITSFAVSGITALACKGLELMALGSHDTLQAAELQDCQNTSEGMAVVSIATLMGAGFSSLVASYVEEASRDEDLD